LTGGTQGLRFLESAPFQVTGLKGTVTVFGHTTTQNHFLYYLTWGIGLLGFAVAWLIVRGRLGRAFRGPRQRSRRRVGRRQPRRLQDARVRDQRRVRGGRRLAGRDPVGDREPAELHGPALDPDRRRRGCRRARLPARTGPRRPLHPVPADDRRARVH